MTDLREQLQDTLGEAYTIERELGGGGMSRVFLAVEHGLRRRVVVKVLPQEAIGALSVERFKREIQFAATLQQANIVPVLNAGESQGVPFYTMPYVEGESLRTRLATGIEIPVPEAIGLLKEIARALSHAHGKHVVHRDIKPDNVLLSGGSAMVTDFGIAKALSDAATSGGGALTGTGSTLGTPAYMAPEQASGDASLDHRADIYAFGCLAYEMLTGAPPFAGRSAREMIAAHLTEEPASVAGKREGLPKALAALVRHCLAKDPAARPQSAVELVYALDDLAGAPRSNAPYSASRLRRGPVIATAVFVVVALIALAMLPIMGSIKAIGPKSVAVLPFANSTGDSTNAYLAEGLSDELRVMLAAIPGLSVKARGSSIAVAAKGAKEAGSRLDVTAVLQGTLTRTATQPRVVAELVNARDETVLWTGSFDLSSTSTASSRETLVRAIAGALRVPSGATGASVSVASRGTGNDSAFAEFLRGEYHRRRFSIDQSVPFLERATQLDPEFARAHASLATAYATSPILGISMTAEAIPKARASAERALRLNPASSMARLARGFILAFTEFNYAGGEAELREATLIDPQSSETAMWHGWVLGSMGRIQEAKAEIDRAYRLDPQATDIMVFRQALAMVEGRWAEGLAESRRILAIDSLNVPARWNLSEIYVLTGKPDSAVAVIEEMLRIDSTGFGAPGIASITYAAAGRWREARRYRAMAERASGNSPNFMRALPAIGFGELDAADEVMAKALRDREPLANSIWLSCEPYLLPLHARPKFRQAMQDLGMTPCPMGNIKWPIGPPKP